MSIEYKPLKNGKTMAEVLLFYPIEKEICMVEK